MIQGMLEEQRDDVEPQILLGRGWIMRNLVFFNCVVCGSRTNVMARSQRHILLSVEYNELTTLLKRAYLLGCRY